MNRSLSDDDSRAVDLLLDQGVGNIKGGVTKMAPVIPQKRLAAVQKVFSLIGQIPAEDPPANLIAKTMRRIDRAGSPAAPPVGRRSTPARPSA